MAYVLKYFMDIRRRKLNFLLYRHERPEFSVNQNINNNNNNDDDHNNNNNNNNNNFTYKYFFFLLFMILLI